MDRISPRFIKSNSIKNRGIIILCNNFYGTEFNIDLTDEVKNSLKKLIQIIYLDNISNYIKIVIYKDHDSKVILTLCDRNINFQTLYYNGEKSYINVNSDYMIIFLEQLITEF